MQFVILYYIDKMAWIVTMDKHRDSWNELTGRINNSIYFHVFTHSPGMEFKLSTYNSSAAVLSILVLGISLKNIAHFP